MKKKVGDSGARRRALAAGARRWGVKNEEAEGGTTVIRSMMMMKVRGAGLVYGKGRRTSLVCGNILGFWGTLPNCPSFHTYLLLPFLISYLKTNYKNTPYTNIYVFLQSKIKLLTIFL